MILSAPANEIKEIRIEDSTKPNQRGYGPEMTIDGQQNTYWKPETKNYHNDWYIVYELPERYTVISTKLMNFGDTHHDITSFKLEVSDDGTTWNTGDIIKVGQPGSKDWKTFDGLRATGKFLRLCIKSTQSGFPPWLREIVFIGYPGINIFCRLFHIF